MNHTFEGEKAFRQLSWSWALAADTKDWGLLTSICAPEVRNYYKMIDPSLPNAIVTGKQFVESWSTQATLGDERLKTQHHLGNVFFEMQGTDHATGLWQAHVIHLRTLLDNRQAKFIAGGYVKHFYDKINGKWMFGGAEPRVPLTTEGSVHDVIGNFPR